MNLYHLIKLTGVIIACTLLADLTHALPLVDFPNARTLYSSDEQVDDYRLTLGELKKANNRWRAEREQRLSGQLQRKTLELGEEHFAEEVFDHYRMQLLQLGGRELFACRSRNCGSSSAWANTRFHVRQLFGLDSEQFYSAFEVINEDDSRSYVALYAVRSPNNRTYLQLDVLVTTETPLISSSTDVIVERLEAGQSFSFVDALRADGGLEDSHLESLKDVLQRKRGWVIGLVGHNYAPQDLAAQQQQSLDMAATVKRQLVAAGIDAERVEVFGLGGLVPGERLGQRESLLQVIMIGR